MEEDLSIKRILVFTKTTGFRHASIPDGIRMFTQITDSLGIIMIHTEDNNYFHPDTLKKIDGVLFLCTSGNILEPTQKQAFETYMDAGGGFLGIHSATDTEYGWAWYGKMIGARFNNHPAIQTATLYKGKTLHPSIMGLPQSWQHEDEWYNFREFASHIVPHLFVDENTYQGGIHGNNHPISWSSNWTKGRSFYTALGHTSKSYEDPFFRRHVTQALEWILHLE
jgi:type 1 glutamine amidotransferase